MAQSKETVRLIERKEPKLQNIHRFIFPKLSDALGVLPEFRKIKALANGVNFVVISVFGSGCLVRCAYKVTLFQGCESYTILLGTCMILTQMQIKILSAHFHEQY